MAESLQRYTYSTVLMGSPVTLTMAQHNEKLAGNVFSLIRQQEMLLTVNRAPSQLMAVNQAAGLHPVQVSASVFNLIKRAKAVSLLKDSIFNVAIGPLVKRWKIGFSGSSIPPADEITALLALTDPQQVILNEEDRSIFLKKRAMAIDAGAIAKGYIADLVKGYLSNQHCQQALINLGGNVQTLGAPTADSSAGWAIGLKKPFGKPDDIIGIIHVIDKSVVTSGIYERYFEQDGRLWHHILNPKTGYPLNNELLSVTVISEKSIDGDIYTTLLYGLGVEKSLTYLRNLPSVEAIFVTRKQDIIISSQRQFHFSLLNNSYRLITPSC